MRFLVLSAVAVTLGGCHPYVTGGYDVSSKVTGPLSSMMGQPVATARQLPSTAATTSATTMTGSTPHTYSLAFGFGTKDVGAEIGVHAFGASTSMFETNDSAQRYATTTGSVDLRWSFLRWGSFSTYVHAGPVVGMVVDKGASSTAFGQGVRYGGGVVYAFPVVMVYVDASQTALQLASGDGSGFNQLTGITVGIGIH